MGSDVEAAAAADSRMDASALIDVQLGERMYRARKVTKMTQRELADRLGVSFQQIQKYEKGENRISAHRLIDLSRIMNLPISFFLEGIPTPPARPGAADASVIVLADLTPVKSACVKLIASAADDDISPVRALLEKLNSRAAPA